jgi:hypothetical protein
VVCAAAEVAGGVEVGDVGVEEDVSSGRPARLANSMAMGIAMAAPMAARMSPFG